MYKIASIIICLSVASILCTLAYGLTYYEEFPNDKPVDCNVLPPEVVRVIDAYPRVYAYCFDSLQFYFKGDTAILNKFLADMSKLKIAKKREIAVVLSPDCGKVAKGSVDTVRPNADVSYNWHLSVETSFVMVNGTITGEVYDRFTINISVSGDIDLAKIELPAMFNAELDGRLSRFVAGHNTRKKELGSTTQPSTEKLLQQPSAIFGPATDEPKEPATRDQMRARIKEMIDNPPKIRDPNAMGTSTSTSSPAVAAVDVQAAMEKVKAALPDGWSVRVQENTVVVTRKEPVHFVNLINADKAKQDETDEQYALRHSHAGEYHIYLRFAPLVTAREYDRLVAENRESAKQLDELAKELRQVDHKYDQYIPRDEPQRQLVAKFEAVNRKVHVLPDLTDGKYSIYLNASADSKYGGVFIIEKDPATTKQTIISLFRPAGTAASRASE